MADYPDYKACTVLGVCKTCPRLLCNSDEIEGWETFECKSSLETNLDS